MTRIIVDIRQTQTRLEIPDGQTILEAALAAGISYPHGCRSGRCGSCKSRLIEGEVQLLQHSRFALTEEEKSDGLILACRALPQTDAAVAWLVGDDEVVEPPRCIDAVVTGLDDLTHDIKLVRVTPADGCPLPFTAGQYARIRSSEYRYAAIPWPIVKAMVAWNFTFAASREVLRPSTYMVD